MNDALSNYLLTFAYIWKIHIDIEKYYIVILLEIIIFLYNYFQDKYYIYETLKKKIIEFLVFL